MLIAIVIMPLFGCHPAQGPQNSQHKTTRTITLEFWTLQMLPFADYIQGLIREYEDQHPNVKIHWVDVPFSEGEKKALTSMLSNTTPDIINLNPDFSAVLASRDALLDMNQWVPAKAKASYLPIAWQTATLHEKTFGIPWYISSAVTLYNRTLLHQAGLTTPPQTIDALGHMAHPFHQKTGAYAIMPSLTEGGRFFRTLLKSDIPLWGSDGRLVFADKGADKVLSFWVNLYRQGAVPSESVTAEQQSAVDRYQSGTLGLLLTGPNFLKIVKENAPQIYAVTDVAPQFPEKSHYTDYSEMLFVIPKRTAHPKEAVDFALFVTNAQNTLELSQLAPVLPPHIAALNSPEFQNPPQPDLMAKARRISAQQLLKARTPLQIHPMQNRLNQLMDFYVQSALLGRLSPEDAMTKAQEEMNRLIGVDTTP